MNKVSAENLFMISAEISNFVLKYPSCAEPQTDPLVRHNKKKESNVGFYTPVKLNFVN